MRRGAPVPETVTLHIPFRFVKRGGRKEMEGTRLWSNLLHLLSY